MHSRLILAAAFLMLLGTQSAQSNVTLKNGNFFMGYTDVSYAGGFEPKVERVYNSKTPFKGIFGWGWGCDFEMYATPQADGSLIVHEYGGGAENRFTPKELDPAALQSTIDALVAAARSRSAITTSDEETAYRKRLEADGNYRSDEWDKYKALNLVHERVLPVGTRLDSIRYGAQYVDRLAHGYERIFENGRREQFDDAGHLTRITDKNANYVEFAYDRFDRVGKMTDNYGRSIRFVYDSRGLVARVIDDRNRTADYRYNDLDELVWTRDVDGNVYDHGYDTDRRHNMTQVRYGDGTTLTIAYYPRYLNENVQSVTDRDGTKTSYSYIAVSPNDLRVRVLVSDAKSKPISNSSYEYFSARDAYGTEWTSRLVTVLDGDRTDTSYNEAGLPISIKHNGEETDFRYDAQGHVLEKDTPDEVTLLEYDPEAAKVSYVKTYPKSNPSAATWSRFKYDSKANLISAENSEGKALTLAYDDTGRMHEIWSKNSDRIQFEYNTNSKPTKISVIHANGAVDAMDVTYTADGEIDKVTSPGGRSAAQVVTSMFQELLDVIRPAGVSLSL